MSDVEEEFKERLRKARDGEIGKTLEEQMAALCYEVGNSHANYLIDEFRDIGWKDVVEWKEEVRTTVE